MDVLRQDVKTLNLRTSGVVWKILAVVDILNMPNAVLPIEGLIKLSVQHNFEKILTKDGIKLMSLSGMVEIPRLQAK